MKISLNIQNLNSEKMLLAQEFVAYLTSLAPDLFLKLNPDVMAAHK